MVPGKDNILGLLIIDEKVKLLFLFKSILNQYNIKRLEFQIYNYHENTFRVKGQTKPMKNLI